MKVILSSIILILGYVIGALPTGAWLSRYYGITDITQHGSGNIGATNVGRLLGVFGFCAVLFIDGFKAFFYLKFLHYFAVVNIVQCLAAGALLLGNGYSVFLGGRGGKGIATSIGIILALAPSLTIGLVLFWLLFFLISNTVGIASIATCTLLPFLSFYVEYGNWHLIGLMVFMSIWGLYRHADNIRRYVMRKELKK